MTRVRITLADVGSFAEVDIEEGDTISRLVERACAKFSHWGVNAGQLSLFLVSAGGDEEPTEEATSAMLSSGARLGVGWSLSRAGISPGAWLVARNTTSGGGSLVARVPPSFSGGSGGGGGGGSGSSSGSAPSGVGATMAASRAAAHAAQPRGPPPSVSEAAGPMFEHEAREVLSAIFRELCPWVRDFSPLLSRNLDRGGNAREADVLCYCEGDTLGPCVPARLHGAEVLLAPHGWEAPLPAARLPPGARFSPTDATRLGPHKYFLAEAYSGASRGTMAAKVLQLDTLCGFLKARWVEQHEGEGVAAVADVTELVGAVALVFSAGDAPRRAALSDVLALVAAALPACPNLSRLSRAGRLLVLVLEKSQAPNTHFQRAVASSLARLAPLEALPEEVAGLESRLDARVAGLAGHVAGLRGEMQEALAALQFLTARGAQP